jgi:oxygen-independent coproporphyrinogen-3 oxidase
MEKTAHLRLAPHPRRNSLYVHIPLCRSKCRYCDFFSVPDLSRETLEKLTAAEIAGIDWFAEALAAASVDTVYFGGGTPSLLPLDLLEKLFARIGSAWQPVEWTVEANPESLTTEFVALCARSGVTRLSLGVQTFDDRLLGILGRPGTAAHTRRALELLAVRWTGDLSLDLITGIPTQTPRAALADVASAIACLPGHLSLYELTLEKGTPLYDDVHSGALSPPPLGDDAGFWNELCAALTAAGFNHYEVSNFARPGKESRHNLQYWRLDPYIGVGPGAASTLSGADGAILRLETSLSFREYCEAGPDEYLACERLDARAVLLEQLMMGLRLTRGIERERMLRRFGRPLEECLGGLWEQWLARGLVAPGQAVYACTNAGRLVLNQLLREAAGAIGRLTDLEVNWP